MRIVTTLATVAAMLLLSGATLAGERANADVECKPAGKRLIYDCMIMLFGKKSRKPMTGAVILIKADMPTMPMAHNVRPVKAMAMGGPGQYRATLELKMYGEWALTMDISGPTRDRVIKKLQFGEMVGHKGAMDGKMKHGLGKMDDSKMGLGKMGRGKMEMKQKQ